MLLVLAVVGRFAMCASPLGSTSGDWFKKKWTRLYVFKHAPLQGRLQNMIVKLRLKKWHTLLMKLRAYQPQHLMDKTNSYCASNAEAGSRNKLSWSATAVPFLVGFVLEPLSLQKHCWLLNTTSAASTSYCYTHFLHPKLLSFMEPQWAIWCSESALWTSPTQATPCS